MIASVVLDMPLVTAVRTTIVMVPDAQLRHAQRQTVLVVWHNFVHGLLVECLWGMGA